MGGVIIMPEYDTTDSDELPSGAEASDELSSESGEFDALTPLEKIQKADKKLLRIERRYDKVMKGTAAATDLERFVVEARGLNVLVRSLIRDADGLLTRIGSVDAPGREIAAQIEALKATRTRLNLRQKIGTVQQERKQIEIRKLPGGNDRKVPFKERFVSKQAKVVKTRPFEFEPDNGLNQPGINWIPIDHLGGGGNAAALWIAVDGNSEIRARVVRKDTHFHRDFLVDATRWAGDPKDACGRATRMALS